MSLATANENRWHRAIVNKSAIPTLDRVARRLVAAKARYQSVEKKTNVPWPLIAVIHEREASQSWMANLAQGDRWDRVSVHIPRGQGPFKSWESAAINALMHSPPYMGRNHDWSIGSSLAELEKYNGLGYAHMGRSSPYIWSKTNQYLRGKYVADGVYSASAVDVQEGCAALLIRMMILDPSINKQYKWSRMPSGATEKPADASKLSTGSVVTPVVIGAGSGAAAHWWQHFNWEFITFAVVFGLVAGFGVYEMYKYWKEKTNV
jgi:lysozyme family protein